jgi:molybdenum cofactor cytidylyltransferase
MVRAGAVVLAAGSSSRLGAPKQLLKDGHETLVHRSVRAAQEGGCAPVVVVAGESYDGVASAVADLDSLVIRNRDWADGIGSSIRVGIKQLTMRDIEAVVFLACDQPAVDGSVVGALIAEHEKSGCPIVASHYADTLGIPALFHRSLFSELASLPDEHGAKMLIQKNPARVAAVNFPGGVFDLDTPEDVSAWQRRV